MDTNELRSTAEHILCFWDHRHAAELLLKSAEYFDAHPEPAIDDVAELGEEK